MGDMGGGAMAGGKGVGNMMGGGGGGGGGKSGGDGGAGAGSSFDPAMGSMGGDPTGGMMSGMGGAGGDMGASGMSDLSGQFGGGGGMDPTGTQSAQAAIKGGGGGPSGATDQPGETPSGVQTQQAPQAPQTPPQLPPQLDQGRAFMEGPGSHPGLTGTPGDPTFATANAPNTTNAFQGGNIAQAYRLNPTSGEPSFGSRWGDTPTGAPQAFDQQYPGAQSPLERVPADVTPPSFEQQFPGAQSPAGNFEDRWAGMPTGAANNPVELLRGNSTLEKLAGSATPPTATAPPETPPAPPVTNVDTGSGITTDTGTNTDPQTSPPFSGPGSGGKGAGDDVGTQAGGGGGGGQGYGGGQGGYGGQGGGGTQAGAGGQFGGGRGSPLEQIIGQFMHMLMGRGGPLGGMEQALMQALGMNRNMFPQFYGGGFNPPFHPGAGAFPPGTTGGRSIGPGARSTPQAPQTPPGTPGTPGSPGNPPSGIAPRQRPPGSLPGYPYTGDKATQPPPWYPGGPGMQAGSGPQAAGTTGPLQQGQVSVPRGSRWQPSMRPTQPTVDRSSFRSQLAQNPQLVQKLAWMVNGEVGKGAPTQAKIVQLETAFNRAYQRGIPLDRALAVHTGRGSSGYYARDTYRREAMPSSSELEQFKSQVLGPVMNGSNMSDVGFGPMTGNASAGVAARQFARQQGYHLKGGDSYFREGPFNRPFPILQSASE